MNFWGLGEPKGQKPALDLKSGQGLPELLLKFLFGEQPIMLLLPLAGHPRISLSAFLRPYARCAMLEGSWKRTS